MPPRSAAPAGVFEHINAPVFENSIKYILHTAVGDGPRVLKAEVRWRATHKHLYCRAPTPVCPSLSSRPHLLPCSDGPLAGC